MTAITNAEKFWHYKSHFCLIVEQILAFARSPNPKVDSNLSFQEPKLNTVVKQVSCKFGVFSKN